MSGGDRIARGGLHVASELDALVAERVAPGTGVDASEFWAGFETLLADLMPRNQALLARREELQAQIDTWHLKRREQQFDQGAYKAFLKEIGYLVAEPAPFVIETQNVDEEIARLAAIPEKLKGVARLCTFQESVKRHVGALARSVNREVAQRRSVYPMVDVVELDEFFGGELTDAIGRERVQRHVLDHGKSRAIAVNRRRGGEDE